MPAPVWFVPTVPGASIASLQASVQRVVAAAGLPDLVSRGDLVALKVHFGEAGNENYIRPPLLQPLVDLAKARGGKPFWTDTCTLYTGRRANAVDHVALAAEHGFTLEATGAPVLIADGLSGRDEVKVEIPGRHSTSVGVASAVAAADAILVASHATGHLVSGLGAALKNLGMGLSARKGKLYQHSVVKPFVDPRRCRGDGACLRWCPEDAIQLVPGPGRARKAVIDPARCIGCGECLAACRPGAVQFKWKMESVGLQERMVEQAWGVLKARPDRVGFVTYLLDVGRDCDCLPSSPDEILLRSVGIVAGRDVVALDQATLDLLERALGRSLRQAAHDVDPTPQLRYAEELGLGTRSYELIEVG